MALINVHIVAPNGRAAAIFAAAFAGTGVDVRYGNLIEFAFDTIVSPANSHGYLDGGIDRVYREHFGTGLETELLDAVQRIGGSLPIGSALTIGFGAGERIRRIIFAPTVEMPEAVPPVNVFRATRAALREASRLEPPVEDIFFPPMGTGVGRVEPEEAAAEMRRAWERWASSSETHNVLHNT